MKCALCFALALAACNTPGGQQQMIDLDGVDDDSTQQPPAAPTTISLDVDHLAENLTPPVTVGMIVVTDPNVGDTHTLELTGNDGGNFALSGDNLVALTTFDREVTTSRIVTVRATDPSGLMRDDVLVVQIDNVNETPTAVAWAAAPSAIEELSVPGLLLGNVVVTDPDAGDTFTLSFEPATTELSANGLSVRTGATPFDYEAGATRSVTVRATDSGGLSVSASLDFAVTDVAEVTTLSPSDPGGLEQWLEVLPPGSRLAFQPGLTGNIVAGAVNVTKNLRITGPGRDVISVQGRLVVSAGVTAEVSGLTLKDYSRTCGSGGNPTLGGCVTNDGTLTLDGVTLDNCRINCTSTSTPNQSGRGGCLYSAGTLVLRDSTLSNCLANTGGALHATGNVTILGSSFFGSAVQSYTNTSTGLSQAAFCGGLNFFGEGTLTMVNSTVHNNGGGTNNSAAVAIGGEMSAILVHLTVAGNNEDYGISGTSDGTVSLRGSAVVVGQVDEPIDDEVSDDGGNVLIDTGTMLFETLADNGGPTQSLMPPAGSEFIDADAACLDAAGAALVEDQRGQSRPLGGACDAGAIERE